ncbi:MAG: ABC transporter permease [Flavobacteriales bacterium]|nr:MAG: ABC transporter permease [Flavobacteriales bacterium]
MKNWWKAIAVILVLYAIVGGLLTDVPAMPILNETIRNLYFHVTMWFAMMTLLIISGVYSIKFISGLKIEDDIVASQAVNIGMLLGFLGLATGMIWARFTWGAWWVSDPKLNGAAITMLAYMAYLILRNSMDDEYKRAKVAAVYNIFAFVMMIVFIWVLPRMEGVDSLHPGQGGNPGFDVYDLNSNMRLVFYPAIIGWTLLGVWILQIKIRMEKLQLKLIYGNDFGRQEGINEGILDDNKLAKTIENED